MRPQPPTSTLFPYTTLFRSQAASAWRRTPMTRSHNPRRASTPGLGWPPFARDRKSTRLNSSHTVISYAVFCLKKKKQAKEQDKKYRLLIRTFNLESRSFETY